MRLGNRRAVGAKPWHLTGGPSPLCSLEAAMRRFGLESSLAGVRDQATGLGGPEVHSSPCISDRARLAAASHRVTAPGLICVGNRVRR
jgi:hypothetical protein